MTKRTRPRAPAPAPTLKYDVEKKELARVLERIQENVGFMRGRVGYLRAVDYPTIFRRLRDAQTALEHVYNLMIQTK